MNFIVGNLSWNPLFCARVVGLGIGDDQLFMERLYSTKVNGGGSNKLLWAPSRKGVFEMHLCCNLLMPTAGIVFLWKKIWKTKAPPRVAFFSWTAALGSILTGESLRKRQIIRVVWCCMCKWDGEKVNHHVLLHCQVAFEVWSFFFSLCLVFIGLCLFWFKPCLVVGEVSPVTRSQLQFGL